MSNYRKQRKKTKQNTKKSVFLFLGFAAFPGPVEFESALLFLRSGYVNINYTALPLLLTKKKAKSNTSCSMFDCFEAKENT